MSQIIPVFLGSFRFEKKRVIQETQRRNYHRWLKRQVAEFGSSFCQQNKLFPRVVVPQNGMVYNGKPY